MTTPAKDLYRVIEDVFNDSIGADFAQDKLVVHCGALISKIDSFLVAATNNGKEYQFFQENLPEIAQIVFNVALGNMPSNAEFKQAKYALLSIHSLMENDEVEPFVAESEDVRKIVTEFKGLVSEASDLPKEVRFYCFTVISAVEQELERFKTFGNFDSQTAVERLIAAISVLAANSTESDNAWKVKVSSLWRNLMEFVNTADTGLSAVARGIELTQLTSGEG